MSRHVTAPRQDEEFVFPEHYLGYDDYTGEQKKKRSERKIAREREEVRE